MWTRILLSPVNKEIHYFYYFSNFTKNLRNTSGSVATFAGRVKQRGLERNNLHVVQVFFDGHLNCKASIWVHVGEGQQICGAHKEVPVEGVDGQTCGDRGENDSFEKDVCNKFTRTFV